MCGIVAYIGHRGVIEILVKGLKRLEYRGYDSAGVGVLLEDKLDRVKIVKKLGKVSNLEAASKVVVRSDTFFFRVFENSKHLLKYRPKNQRLVLLILGGQLMEHPQIVTLILTITKPVRSRSFTTVSSRITVP